MNYKQRTMGVTTLALALVTSTALAQAPADNNAKAPVAAPPAITLKDALTGKDTNQPTPDPQANLASPPAPPAVVKIIIPKKQPNPQRLKLEQNLRGQMAAFGFAGADTQNALIAYIRKEEHARWPLKQSAKRMAQCLNAGATPPPDDQIRAAVTDFRNELEKDRLRRQQAETDLDAKIGFSQNARLEAMLILFGIVGDTQVVMIPAPPLPAQPATAVTASTTPANPLPMPPLPTVPANANPTPLLAVAPRNTLPLNTMPMPLATPGTSPALSLQLDSVGARGRGQDKGLARRDDFFTVELREELLRRFDKNNDNRLDRAERAEAMAYLRSALNLKDAEVAAENETTPATPSPDNAPDSTNGTH